jgi:5,10-methylenetetrahydrofolate reductase
MRIDHIPASSGPTFSFEFFPPKTEVGEQNLR